MFSQSHETLEAITNRVEIVDFDYETMQELLRFIYCEKVFDLEGVALDLLPAADKVLKLKKLKFQNKLVFKIPVQFVETQRYLLKFPGRQLECWKCHKNSGSC
jgi:hypothetical protein